MEMEKLKRIAEIFELIGNPIRLGILFVLYGSDLLRDKGSMTFTELREVMRLPNDAILDYHLKKLIEAGLVTKKAVQKDPTSKITPVYKVTEKLVSFLEETGLAEPLKKYMEDIIKR